MIGRVMTRDGWLPVLVMVPIVVASASLAWSGYVDYTKRAHVAEKILKAAESASPAAVLIDITVLDRRGVRLIRVDGRWHCRAGDVNPVPDKYLPANCTGANR